MIEKLLKKEREYLNYFFDNIDPKRLDEVVELLAACKGSIIFSGVGKSGLVARKIATTMTSVGTRTIFLSPLDALHGDIGIVQKEDVFLMLSKSGDSDELLHLAPYLRNKGATLIAVVCREQCRLTELCDITMLLPLKKELCPFNLMPTVSCLTQMIFGDLISVALMQKKHFTLDDYHKNHPAGTLGKRLALKVKDLMLTEDKIPLCLPDDLLVDELVELSQKQCGCILIVDNEMILQGIFTDGDLRRALLDTGSDALQEPMKELMVRNPRATEPNILAVEAMKQMESHQKKPITVLPVLGKKGEVLGVIKMHDILQSGI